MYGRFKKYVSAFLDEMTEGVRLEYMEKSKRYKMLQSKKRRLQSKVIESIPEDKQELFFEYEETVSLQYAFIEDYIYRRGIFHGIRVSGIFIKLLNL